MHQGSTDKDTDTDKVTDTVTDKDTDTVTDTDKDTETEARFKALVKEKLNEKALLVLNSMKEDKSKLDKLKYNSVQMQGYLSDSNMSTRHKKLVFQARTHMLKTAANFGDKTTSCPLGCDSLDNQEHLVACDVVKMNNYDVHPVPGVSNEGGAADWVPIMSGVNNINNINMT